MKIRDQFEQFVGRNTGLVDDFDSGGLLQNGHALLGEGIGNEDFQHLRYSWLSSARPARWTRPAFRLVARIARADWPTPPRGLPEWDTDPIRKDSSLCLWLDRDFQGWEADSASYC